MNVTIYNLGDTVLVLCYHELYNTGTEEWSYADPDTGFPKVSFTDPKGVEQLAPMLMTQDATGKFHYLYELPSDAEKGWWRIYVQVENGGYPDGEYASVEVK